MAASPRLGSGRLFPLNQIHRAAGGTLPSFDQFAVGTINIGWHLMTIASESSSLRMTIPHPIPDVKIYYCQNPEQKGVLLRFYRHNPRNYDI